MFKKVTFMDYIFGGCQINLHVAFDFTASNGDQNTKNSLHHIGSAYNQYTSALRSVGSILQYYDHDNLIPAYGFGAQLPTLSKGSYHKFALNGCFFDPYCNGIEGVEACYKNALKHVRLYGPTNFSQIISEMNDRLE